MAEKLKRVGLLVPASDGVSEPDFQHFLPKGVVFHTARLYQDKALTRGFDNLQRMYDEGVAAAESVALAKPDVIVYSCTSASFFKGYGSDRALAGAIQKATGIPAVVTSTAAVDDVSALLAAARTSGRVRAGRVGLVGNSRGSIASLLTAALAGGSMQAVVAVAGAPPAVGPLFALGISAPVLLLQGDADAVVSVQNSRALEAALRTLGKPVQSYYYAGADHGFLFEAQWHADAMGRLTAFLQETIAR